MASRNFFSASKKLFSLGFFFIAILPCLYSAETSPKNFSLPVSLPPSLATVQSYSAASPDAPLLIMIQDAHGQYEAQKNLSEILRYLALQYNLSLVLVEGGAGDMDVSELRKGVSAEKLNETGEKWLKAGKLSGEEYLDLVWGGKDIRLWGVEDPSSYTKNMEAYLVFEKVQPAAFAAIKKWKDYFGPLRKKYFSPHLEKLETLKETAVDEPKKMEEYFKFLAERAYQLSIEFNAYPDFNKWIELQAKEKEIDTEQVAFEEKELSGTLSKRLTKEELYPLQEETPKTQGIDSEIRKIRMLLDLKAKTSGLDGYSTVAMEKALGAFLRLKEMQASEVFEDAGRLHDKLREQDLTDAKVKELAQIVDYLALASRLFHLEWTLQDENKFIALASAMASNEMGKDLTSDLSVWLPQAKAFYQMAREREKAIVENSFNKIGAQRKKERKSPRIYVLIVGGYHAANLKKEFTAKGLSVMNVVPKFSPSSTQSYFEVLKEKWGTGEAWYTAARQSNKPADKKV